MYDWALSYMAKGLGQFMFYGGSVIAIIGAGLWYLFRNAKL